MNKYKLTLIIISLLMVPFPAFGDEILVNKSISDILNSHKNDVVKQSDKFISVECVRHKMPCQILYQLHDGRAEDITYEFTVPDKTSFTKGLKIMNELIRDFIKAKDIQVRKLKLNGIIFTKALGDVSEPSHDYLLCQGNYETSYQYDIKIGADLEEGSSQSYVTGLSIRIYTKISRCGIP